MDLVTATAAPSVITALNKEWKLGVLRLDDYGALEQWVRSQIVRFARDAVADLPQPEREAMASLAIRQAGKVSIATAASLGRTPLPAARTKLMEVVESGVEDDIKEAVDAVVEAATIQAAASTDEGQMFNTIMSSPNGLLRVFYYSLCVHHGKQMTVAKAQVIGENMDGNLADVVAQIFAVSQGAQEKTPKKEDPDSDSKEDNTSSSQA